MPLIVALEFDYPVILNSLRSRWIYGCTRWGWYIGVGHCSTSSLRVMFHGTRAVEYDGHIFQMLQNTDNACIPRSRGKETPDHALSTPQILSDTADPQVLIPPSLDTPPRAIAGLLWLPASSCTHESGRCMLHNVPGPAAVPALSLPTLRVHSIKRKKS